MKYICQIIGNGTEESPFRPAIADYPVSWSACIDSDERGSPVSSCCVVTVHDGDVSLFSSDSRIEAING